DAARRPRCVGEERTEMVADRVRPPAERPEEKRAVLRLPGKKIAGHPVQNPATEHSQGQPAVKEQRQQILRRAHEYPPDAAPAAARARFRLVLRGGRESPAGAAPPAPP